jgi:RHS repeat-associated protein
VVLPTGGAYEYDYPAAPMGDCGNAASTTAGCIATGSQPTFNDVDLPVKSVFRRVTERRTFRSGATPTGGTQAAVLEGVTDYSPNGGVVTVTSSGATGTVLSTDKHVFSGDPSLNGGFSGPPTAWYGFYLDGKETETDLGLTGTTPARKSQFVFSTTAIQGGNVGYINTHECETFTTVNDGSATLSSGSLSIFDTYSNVTDTLQYGYGSGLSLLSSCPASTASAPPGYTRALHTGYLTGGYDTVASTADATNHMRALPTETDTFDPAISATTPASKTTYGYDAGSTTSRTPTYSGGFQSLLTGRVPGNLTSKSEIKTGSSALTIAFAYDQLGNLVSVTEPRLNVTTFGYTDACDSGPTGMFAYRTSTTNALLQTASARYDCNNGAITSITDANNVTTPSSSTPDPFDRLILVTHAAGAAGRESKTQIQYPSLNQVAINSDLTAEGDGATHRVLNIDGLGRTSEQDDYIDATHYIAVRKTYDGKGRPATVTNPYLAGTETANSAATTYDGLDRAIRVATADGAPTTTGYTVDTANALFTATVTDPAGSKRAAGTDALGRTMHVTEYQGSQTYQTSYLYDVLDELTSVAQSGLGRQFTYNSLRQLVTATNPESGTICYGTVSGSTCAENYDANGNLLKKTDALGLAVSYGYDALNRLASKTYSDGTPSVSMTYDAPGVANSTGRVTLAKTTNPSTGQVLTSQSITSYHQRGWPTGSVETIGSNAPMAFSYDYNLAGGMKYESYPSGRALTTGFDALNRPVSVNGVLSGVAETYVNQAQYASNGAISSIAFGTAGSGISQTVTFDGGSNTLRGQPTKVQASVGASSVWSLNYGYCAGGAASCATNNGNLKTERIVTGAFDATQTFAYDGINRLTDAVETQTASPATVNWGQHYAFDAFGNRAVVSGTAPNNYIPTSALTPQVTSQTGAVPFSNNRWLGATHAVSGEITGLNGVTYGYDAEKRLTTVTNEPSMPGISYAYDANGKRVQKTVGSAVTLYAYDAAGELAAEYGPATNAAPGTSYLVTDALGSTRAELDTGGNLTRTIDYLPFGEEIPNGVGGRPQPPYLGVVYPSSTPDGVPVKFTGKERDAETGLDYFGARYMSSAQGRFTSPDPSNMGVDFFLPQTWNRYAYVGNNPLAYVDQNGLWWTSSHNAAIAEALPGLSAADLKSVQNGSLAADKGQIMGMDAQSPAVSFAHHMSSGTDSDRASAVGTAVAAEARFISDGQGAARSEQAAWIAAGHTGLSPKALQIFGNFTHPAVDATSPVHEGHQPWSGCGANLVACVWHGIGEAPILFNMNLGGRKESAISILQFYFVDTFGSDAARKADPEGDRRSSHRGCLIDRDTGGCAP